jgi:hypothetical protein
MMKKMKSGSALGAAVGLALIGFSVSPLAAFAHEEQVQLPLAGVVSSDEMTVVRDATTGKLRMPNAKEHEDMRQQQLQQPNGRNLKARVAPGRTLQKWHANGAVGARLTDEHISSVVMVRKADGSLEKQCFDSDHAAESAVKSHAIAGSFSGTQLETE